MGELFCTPESKRIFPPAMLSKIEEAVSSGEIPFDIVILTNADSREVREEWVDASSNILTVQDKPNNLAVAGITRHSNRPWPQPFLDRFSEEGLSHDASMASIRLYVPRKDTEGFAACNFIYDKSGNVTCALLRVAPYVSQDAVDAHYAPHAYDTWNHANEKKVSPSIATEVNIIHEWGHILAKAKGLDPNTRGTNGNHEEILSGKTSLSVEAWQSEVLADRLMLTSGCLDTSEKQEAALIRLAVNAKRAIFGQANYTYFTVPALVPDEHGLGVHQYSAAGKHLFWNAHDRLMPAIVDAAMKDSRLSEYHDYFAANPDSRNDTSSLCRAFLSLEPQHFDIYFIELWRHFREINPHIDKVGQAYVWSLAQLYPDYFKQYISPMLKDGDKKLDVPDMRLSSRPSLALNTAEQPAVKLS